MPAECAYRKSVAVVTGKDPTETEPPTLIAPSVNVTGTANSSCFFSLSAPVSTTCAMVRELSQKASPPSGRERLYGSDLGAMGAMARDLRVLRGMRQICPRRAESVTTHLRSSKEYVLTGMRAKSPSGLGRGALGLGRVSMSCGERMSGEALRVNSVDIVGGAPVQAHR